MRTLVTGATGLLGNNVVRALLARGEEVRVLVRPPANRRELGDLRVEVQLGDICNPAEVQRACAGMGAVIHSAAHVHVGWSGLELARQVNVEGTRQVALAARNEGARLVHVSSVDALGVGAADAPANEDSPRQGKINCPYVLTKREAEQVVQQQIEQGLDAVIVNPGFMLGPWDWKPSSGRMLLEVARRFTPFAPKGGCSVCDVRDVADGVLAARDRGVRGRRYILAGQNMTYFELWKLMARVAGGRAPVGRAGPLMRIVAGWCGDLWARFGRHEPDVNSAAIAMSSLFHYYDSSRAEQELGYRCRPPEEAAQAAWRWFKEYSSMV